MKQATLLDYPSPIKATPSRQPEASSSKAHKKIQKTKPPPKPTCPPARKKRKIFNEDESNSDDLGRIKLESKEPIEVSDSSSESSSETESQDSSKNSDEVPIPTSSKRFMKLKAFVDNEQEEEEEEVRHHSSGENSEEEVAPKRRRLTRRRKTPVKDHPNSETEDFDDLDQERVIESRFRERKMTAFQKNLEKLKKKKQKQLISCSSSEDEDQDSDKPAKSFKGAKPSTSTYGGLFGSSDEVQDESETSSASESDFIVEDGPLGAPLLPAEFSMETHEDLSHQFKKIFQFFVHIAVQPPKKRKKFMEKNMEDEEYFSVPLMVSRRKIYALRDSLVASSVWRPDFKKALERYPKLSLIRLDFAIPECDACHLGRRMSTICGKLEGKPYDRFGFRTLKTRKDDSDDSDYDETPLETVFNLGRFCARRTQVYHQFSHWEYELFTGIDREIEELRSMQTQKKGKKFHRVAYPGGKKPPDDLTDADDLCEWLDERKIIDTEWQKVKAMMESARHLELESKRGDAD